METTTIPVVNTSLAKDGTLLLRCSDVSGTFSSKLTTLVSPSI